jgi:FMN phosphatase YigB (HAD superfamily)
MRHFGVAPQECLYVGDRADVDGAAAEAAGVMSVIVTSSSSRSSDRFTVVSGYPQLQAQLFAGPARLAAA